MNSFAGRIPLFNGTNYGTWKAQMEAVLHKGRLLNIVLGLEKPPRIKKLPEFPTTAQTKEHEESMFVLQVYNDKDMDARAEILMSLESSIVTMVKNMKSSQEIWQYLQDTFDRKSMRKKIECYRKLLNMKMSDNESVSQFLIDFDVCVSSFMEMGIEIDEDLLAVVLVDALPDRFSALKAAVDTANEFPKITVLKSRLLEVGDKEVVIQDAVMKAKFRTKNQDRGNKNRNTQDEGMSNFPFKCYRCGKKGHRIKNCKVKMDNTSCVNENEVLVTTTENVFTANSNQIWVVDSGASSHMCTQLSLFTHIDKSQSGKVRLADDKAVDVKGIGKVSMTVKVNGHESKIGLLNTLYVPDLRCNLISTSKLTDNGCKVVMKGKNVTITRKGVIVLEGYKRENIYVVNTDKNIKDIVNIVRKYDEKDIELWHKRYGHLNSNQLKQLERDNSVKGLPKFKNVEIDCVSCIRGKQTRLPFPQKNEKSSKEVLGLIHTDLCGPMNTESMGGSLYFATFIDDYSRKVFVYFIRRKSQYLEKFKEFKNMVETQTGNKLKMIRSDNAAELVSYDFTKYLKDNGIRRQLTVEYTPQQNGVAERMNRTLVEMARCHILESGLPLGLWTELILASAYIRNRCPTKLNGMKTPEELWSGKKPVVKHLRRIGCKAFVLNKRSNRSKFDAKSNEFIFIGYSEESKAYRLWKAGTKKIEKSRDVKFIEQELYKNIEGSEPHNFYEFAPVENLQNKTTEDELNDVFENVCDDIEVQDASEETLEEERLIEKSIAKETPVESIKERLRSWAFRKPEESANSVDDIIDPKTVKEALASDRAEDWHKAMQDEYKSLMKNGTWALTDLPNGRKPVGCKWVFKSKIRPDGTIEKRKARLVAKGYSQKYGLDYVDTFAPVVRQTSLRLLYALSVEHNLKLRQLDVSTAFLNGNLDEEIYMEQPEMFVEEASIKKVCKLRKAIYGLKQAGRQWFKRIDAVIKEFGLTQSKNDQCIYYIRNTKITMILALYVDDIIIASNDNALTDKFVRKLQDHFDIRDMGVPKHCIGLEVDVKDGEISISQPGYISSIVKKYGLENCKPVKIPMQANIKLEKEPTISGEAEKVDEKLYQEIIGSLLYLSLYSRPDIMCAVSMLSQFSKDPRKQHLNAAYYVIKYLNSTKNAVLTYRKSGLPLKGFCDANWAQDVNDRKSQSGFCFLLAGGLVSWESKKQKVVATSSAEAEYVALTEATKEASYLGYVLHELGYSSQSPIVMFTDSQSAQQMAKFGAHHSRTKHIHYKYHYVREAIDQQIIELRYLPTGEMLADVLTKPLPKVKHVFCCNNFGIVIN